MIRVLFTLAALLLTSPAFADFYRIWWSGSTYLSSCNAYDLCEDFASRVPYMASGYPSGNQCVFTNVNPSVPNESRLFTVNPGSGEPHIPGGCPSSCPDGEVFDEYGKCVPVPPPDCPDGQFMENGQCVSGCVAGATVRLVLPLESVQFSTIDPILGCNLEMKTGQTPECNLNTMLCNVYYTDTGVYNDSFSYDNGEPPEEPAPVVPTELESTETVTGPVVSSESNPDGSTTTTEITEINRVNNQGAEVEIIGDSIVLKNQEGEIIDILQQQETIIYSDGSSKITETVTTTATPNSVTEVKKNLTDGSTTVTTRTYNTGFSGTTTTTEVTTYDANGKKTGSGKVTNGTITNTGGGQGGEGDSPGSFCNYAEIICQLADWFLEEPLYPDNPEVPFTEITMDDVDEFDSGVGAGQCPADVVISTQFGSVPISWQYPCELATTFRPVVLFFAWIAALYIVVRVK